MRVRNARSARIGNALHRCGAARQLLGDINSRSRTRFDNPFHQQQVIGANHGVARYRQLLGELPRRRQPRTRPDPHAADRLADLVDDLRRQRFLTGPIEEDGYQHCGTAPVVLSTEQGLGQLWVQRIDLGGNTSHCQLISRAFPTGSFTLPPTGLMPAGPSARMPRGASRSCPKRFIALHLLAICWAIWEVARRLRGWLMEPTHFSPAALVAVLYAVRASSH